MGAGATPPGWYPDVERPGGERYWDGSSWTENRRGGDASAPAYGGGFGQAPGNQGGVPGYGQQPAAYGAPQGYQPYGAFGRAYQKSSNAGVALALSIGGLLCCGLLAIPGLIMGRKEMNDVDAGLIDPSSRGTAKAAFIVGVIGVSLMAVGIILYAVIIAAAAGSA